MSNSDVNVSTVLDPLQCVNKPVRGAPSCGVCGWGWPRMRRGSREVSITILANYVELP